jgi:stringent starvation protein B
MTVTSRRPYLIRAIYDWALENSLTPHLVVSAQQPGVVVPQQYVNEGKITLNIGPRAAHQLHIGNETISFTARFGGQPFSVVVPPGAVLAVYARENGEGVVFGETETDGSAPPDPPPAPPEPKRPAKPHLRIVK